MNVEFGGFLAVGLVFAFYLVSVGGALFAVVSTWRILEKAGQPGWPALVPVYGGIVLLRVLGRPAWWFALYLVPPVNLVVYVLVCLGLARAFGKGTDFAYGLIFLHLVFLAILAFGTAELDRSSGGGRHHEAVDSLAGRPGADPESPRPEDRS